MGRRAGRWIQCIVQNPRAGDAEGRGPFQLSLGGQGKASPKGAPRAGPSEQPGARGGGAFKAKGWGLWCPHLLSSTFRIEGRKIASHGSGSFKNKQNKLDCEPRVSPISWPPHTISHSPEQDNGWFKASMDGFSVLQNPESSMKGSILFNWLDFLLSWRRMYTSPTHYLTCDILSTQPHTAFLHRPN